MYLLVRAFQCIGMNIIAVNVTLQVQNQNKPILRWKVPWYLLMNVPVSFLMIWLKIRFDLTQMLNQSFLGVSLQNNLCRWKKFEGSLVIGGVGLTLEHSYLFLCRKPISILFASLILFSKFIVLFCKHEINHKFLPFFKFSFLVVKQVQISFCKWWVCSFAILQGLNVKSL